MNCQICDGIMIKKFTVPFKYSLNGTVDYFQCADCGYIKAPLFDKWTKEEWLQIYNDRYHLIDTGSKLRQIKYAKIFSEYDFNYHLDFGSGEGLVSKILVKHGKRSYAYDPFYNKSDLPNIKFDFISAIEVLEHLTDPNLLFKTINSLSCLNCKLVATTKLISNFSIPVEKFWYVNPYAGHICFYSDKSLVLLAEKHRWNKILTKDDDHFFVKGNNINVI